MTSRSTRAAVLVRQRDPAPYAGSRPVEIARVQLDPPGPGEALVRIASVGLCHSDLSTVDGTFPRGLPLVLGHEAAGTVEEVGPGVTALAPGDTVVCAFVPSCGACEPCASGRPALCVAGNAANAAGTLLRDARRFHRDGAALFHHLGVSGFAERTVCAVESLVRVPSDTPLEIAALFGCAALTGLGAVLRAARVPAGASVAIFGGGGVGLMALLGTRVAGAHAVLFDPLESKRALALELGAQAALDPRAEGALEALRAIFPGGAGYAIEAAGRTDALELAVRALRPGGTAVAVGLPPAAATAALSHGALVRREIAVRGSFMGSALPHEDIPAFVALWREGRLPVERLVTKTFALDDINAELDLLAAGGTVRSVCRLDA